MSKLYNLPIELHVLHGDNISGSYNLPIELQVFYGGRLYNLPIELRVIHSGLQNRIMKEVHQKPMAYVEFVDVDGSIITLSTCTRFTVTQSRSEILGSFSCTIAHAGDWNPRSSLYSSLFDIDKRKRIRIYYGQNIDGVDVYVKIFTGIVTKKPETYSSGGSNYITLSGSNLGYLLQRLEGTYAYSGFTGRSKKLLEYWLDKAGIKHLLSYTDSLWLYREPISYFSALTGLQACKLILGPDKEAFFDAEGFFVYRDIPEFSSDEVEFAYEQANIISLDRRVDTNKITTRVVIEGSFGDFAYEKEASATMIEKYGRNSLSRNNGWINTYEKAVNLANAILDLGACYENVFAIRTILNPYLSVGSSITVIDTALSSTPLTQVRSFETKHTFIAGSTQQTTIECYLE